MKKVTLFLTFAVASWAGVLKVATQPVRHPWKDSKTVVKLATYPVRHPKKVVF